MRPGEPATSKRESRSTTREWRPTAAQPDRGAERPRAPRRPHGPARAHRPTPAHAKSDQQRALLHHDRPQPASIGAQHRANRQLASSGAHRKRDDRAEPDRAQYRREGGEGQKDAHDEAPRRAFGRDDVGHHAGVGHRGTRVHRHRRRADRCDHSGRLVVRPHHQVGDPLVRLRRGHVRVETHIVEAAVPHVVDDSHNGLPDHRRRMGRRRYDVSDRRWPIGSTPGQKRRAVCWLTTTTPGDSRLSVARNPRPRTTLMPIASK